MLVEFGRRGTRHAGDIAGELAYRRLKPQADAEERNLVHASIARCGDLPLEGALAEAARHEDAVHRAERLLGIVVGELLAIDEVHFHVAPLVDARMPERLDDGEICIRERDVLAHDRDVDLALAIVRRLEKRLQRRQVDRAHLKPELVENLHVEALLIEGKRHLVDGGRVDAGEHVLGRHVAEQRDLLAHLVGDLVVGAAHDEVGLHTDGAQLLHGMLRRLGLHLVSCGDIGNERHMHEEHIARVLLFLELAGSFDERLGLDVADRAADLGDDDVGVRLGSDAAQTFLNGLGHMRDDLHGSAEEVAAALARDKRLVDGALREVGLARKGLVDEALVMAQVEVTFVAVVGNEDLAMLERAHGARIDVQVRVHLLHGHLVAARLEQMPQRRRRDALAQ